MNSEINDIKKQIADTALKLNECMETLNKLSELLSVSTPGEPCYVKIIIDSDVMNYDADDFTLYKEGEDCELIVNIKTGHIENWPGGSDALHVKAVDAGTYILYDEDMNEIRRIEGYVPNRLIPEHDGYGDYIDIRISDSGYITNWYNHPLLDDFYNNED